MRALFQRFSVFGPLVESVNLADEFINTIYHNNHNHNNVQCLMRRFLYRLQIIIIQLSINNNLKPVIS